jgi:hypothetical protein
MICATIAPKASFKSAFGAIGCRANHINAQLNRLRDKTKVD